MVDDQPMWGNNRTVAPTPGAAIIAVDLGDNFTVKGHHLSMIKDRQFNRCSWADPHKHIAEFVKICGMFCYGDTNADAIKLKLFPSSLAGEAKIWFNELSPDEPTQAILDAKGIFLYKTPNEAHQLQEDRVLLKLYWSKENKAKPLRKTVAFAKSKENSPLLEKMEALTTRIDSQFKEIRGDMKEMRVDAQSGRPLHYWICDDKPYRRTQARKKGKLCHRRISRRISMKLLCVDILTMGCRSSLKCRKLTHGEENCNPRLPKKDQDDTEFKENLREFRYSTTTFGGISDHQSSRPTGTLPSNTQTNLKPSTSKEKPYRPPPARNEHVNAVFTRRSHMNYDTCFHMDIIDKITEDELDALLDDSKPFLNTSEKISKTPLDKEFDKFMSENVQEDEVKDDFEELPPKDELRIKTSIQDLPTDLEMKPLPKHLEYAFLEENSLLLVVISALLEQNEKERLVSMLKNHKEAFAWKTSDILGISPSFCKYKINFEDDVNQSF
ncbi:hypothetical protein Tco_0623366 [Tanacetum coccineum]